MGKTTARWPELLKAFECADVIAPVDADAFGKRAGELICRKKGTQPTAGKYRLLALQCQEVAAQTHESHAKNMLTLVAKEFIQAARRAEENGAELYNRERRSSRSSSPPSGG